MSYDRKAAALLHICHSLVMSSFDDFGPRSPVIGSLAATGRLERWDIVMTVAAVASALGTLETRLSTRQFRAFHASVERHLRRWNPASPKLLQHLIQFIVERSRAQVNRADATGEWVISNLKRDAPTDEELHIAPELGQYLADAFAHWWEQSG